MPAGKRAGGEVALRREIVETCRTMNALGINQGTSGNVSARCGGRLLITPSGVPYETLSPDDIVAMPLDADDGRYEGALAPSSEWRFHIAILRARQDVGAVVHTQRPYATALALRGTERPRVPYTTSPA